MIHNHAQLAIQRKLLAHAENALVDLHKEVYAKNPRNYTVFSESYIDMILKLRAEIDAFLRIAPAPPDPQRSGDNGTASGESVGQDASAEAITVAGTLASTS